RLLCTARPPPTPPLFPYTTLFRSRRNGYSGDGHFHWLPVGPRSASYENGGWRRAIRCATEINRRRKLLRYGWAGSNPAQPETAQFILGYGGFLFWNLLPTIPAI